MNTPIAKKALLISGIIQVSVVCLITYLVNDPDWGGHTALSLGMLLQFPGSMAGVFIIELLRYAIESGEALVSVACMITVLLQFAILSMTIYFILNRRHKSV